MLRKPGVYAGLQAFKRLFDNKLITVISAALFLLSGGLQVSESSFCGLHDCKKIIIETPLAVGNYLHGRGVFCSYLCGQ